MKYIDLTYFSTAFYSNVEVSRYRFMARFDSSFLLFVSMRKILPKVTDSKKLFVVLQLVYSCLCVSSHTFAKYGKSSSGAQRDPQNNY